MSLIARPPCPCPAPPGPPQPGRGPAASIEGHLDCLCSGLVIAQVASVAPQLLRARCCWLTTGYSMRCCRRVLLPQAVQGAHRGLQPQLCISYHTSSSCIGSCTWTGSICVNGGGPTSR